MDTGIYTNRGEEVPLGVECALPHLVARAQTNVQRTDSVGYAVRHLFSLNSAKRTHSPGGDVIRRTFPTLRLV